MLNHNKRSITHRQQEQEGHGDPGAPDQDLRRAGRELRARRARPHGLTWERIQELNPRMIYASVKGFGPGPYEDCKVYENVAQCTGGVGLHHRLPRWPAAGDRRADRRQRHRPAPGARHRHGALSPHQDAARASASRCAMQDGVLEPGAREDARPAAPRARAAHGIQPARRRHSVRRGRAARRQRLRRRPAGPHPQVQGLGERSRRLHLFHHAGAGVGGDLRRDRRARLEDASRLRQAAGAPAAPQRDLRPHREVDHDQDQVRGHGDPATSTTSPAGRSCP